MLRLCSLALMLTGAALAAPYKLATLLPISSPYAHNAESLNRGAELALRDLQDDLGKAGLQISLVKLDDQASVPTALKQAQQLIDDSSVMGVVSSYTSGITVPVSELLSKANLAQMAIGTASAVTDRKLGNISRVVARNDAQGKVMARYLKDEKQVRQVYVLSDATTYGDGLAGDFSASAQQLGIRVLGKLSTSKRSGFEQLAANIKALKPDYLYFGGEYDSALSMLNALRQLGVQTPIAGGDTLNDKAFFQASSKLQNGLVFSDIFGQLQSFANWTSFQQRYTAQFGSAPDALSLFGYDSAQVLLRGMIAATSNGTLTRPAVMNAVRAVRLNGVTGPIAFDAKGDRQGAPVFVIHIDPKSFLPTVLKVITRY